MGTSVSPCTWGAFVTTPWRDSLHSCALCFAMAVAMPFHIHMYGMAAVLLGRAVQVDSIKTRVESAPGLSA
jgi:hypothetical protein